MKLYKNSSKKYNPELISMVRVMSEKHPTYGYKRITAVIKRTYNITLDSKTVLRYRQYLGIKPLQPKRQRKVNNGLVVSKIAPNIINRNFKPIAPNLIWSVDITYVSHLENISYYGNNDEAHQVYQFALPPLTLHTFISGDSSKLTEWAKTIDRVSDNATYFNFLASHDGIGMRPTEGILTDDERQTIFNHAEVNGGKFNMKSNPDGTESVYEMNVTYFDAIKDSKQTES